MVCFSGAELAGNVSQKPSQVFELHPFFVLPSAQGNK